MNKTYNRPFTEIVNLRTEGVLYTTSIPYGGEDDGTLPIDAKQQAMMDEEWEEEETDLAFPRYNAWED